MLDFYLAEMFDVPTKSLNLSVKRNSNGFPNDFMFHLTKEEWESLRFQIETSKKGGLRYLPYAFTEHGVTMLGNILRSEIAVNMSIAIVRAFIALRQMALQYKELAAQLAKLEKETRKQFKDVYEALNYLPQKKKKEEDFNKRERIGFKKGS
jgi:ORF6N domain